MSDRDMGRYGDGSAGANTPPLSLYATDRFFAAQNDIRTPIKTSLYHLYSNKVNIPLRGHFSHLFCRSSHGLNESPSDKHPF